MKMEDATLWQFVSGSGILTLNSAIKTEGNTSMQIEGNGWQQIRSVPFNTQDFNSPSNTMSFDFYVGSNQPNPYWVGDIQLLIHCPSVGIFNQSIGNVGLTGLPRDTFTEITFILPQEVMDALNGTVEDFHFSIALNTNSGSGPYYIDNIRFDY